MSDLEAEVRRIIEELNPGGGGYRTKEAADLLHLWAMEGCVVTPIAEQLMRLGAGEAINKNRARVEPGRAIRTVLASASSDQGDMAEVAPEDLEGRTPRRRA